MPTITLTFSTEAGEAVLAALEAGELTANLKEANPLARLRKGLLALIRREELAHRRRLKLAEGRAITSLAADLIEDKNIGT